MPSDVPSALRALRDHADRQRGVITSRQAQSAGLSRDEIAHRVRSGRWQRLHTGVYAVFSGPPDRQSVLWAAVLRAGQGAMLSYQTAAELDRLVDRSSSSIHLTIPAARRIPGGIPGTVVHLRCDAQRAAHPSRLPPRTRIEETVLDLADAAGSAWDAVGWVSTAVGRRLTTQHLLSEALGLRSRLRWRADLTIALSPDLAGIHSVLEYRYLRDVERPHGLPKGTRQARVSRDGVVEYRDVLYEEFSLAVELDGAAAHPAGTRWRDIRRDNLAAASGITTLRYGYRDVSARPCAVASEVASVLSLHGWQGTPRPCSPGCPAGAAAAP